MNTALSNRSTDSNGEQWSEPPLRLPIPACRDPFVNTPLLRAGMGRDNVERFWISSWNDVSGTTGVLVDERGRERIYRFDLPHAGFYSAVVEDDDTLWLCGDLSRVVCLTLSSGAYHVYETGAPAALVFQGMIIDKEHKKLFVLAYPGANTVAISFDYERRTPVRVYEEVYEGSSIDPAERSHYGRFSYPNLDGTHTLLAVTPGCTLVRWDPREELITTQRLYDVSPQLWRENEKALNAYYYSDISLICNEAGQRYLPHYGWFDVRENTLVEGPRPEREMNWFARYEHFVWGCESGSEGARVGLWDCTSGSVRHVCTIANGVGSNINMTTAGKLVSVSLYGEFQRYDAYTGHLELSRRLPADSVGYVDCLCRIDEKRLLGTPFITQRFWEINLDTGTGYDCGRAAPGAGEVMLTWNVNNRIYMASYTDGLLTEYDPACHPHYPENPRLVAATPGGMRPVTGARSGDDIYYSCSRHYGETGCVLTRFDTKTGEAFHAVDPLDGLCIRSWHYDEQAGCLLAGTTFRADCNSCPPVRDDSPLAWIDPIDLRVRRMQNLQLKCESTTIHGPLGQGKYLASALPVDGDTMWLEVSIETAAVRPIAGSDLLCSDVLQIAYTGMPGFYVILIDGRVEIRDMMRLELVKRMAIDAPVYRCHVQDGVLYCLTRQDVIIFDDLLVQLSSV